MDQGPFFFIALLMVFLAVSPLVVYYPVYLIGWWRRREEGRNKGADFKPSTKLFIIYIWFMLIIAGSALFVPLNIRFNERTRNIEAKMNLGAVYTSQVAYFGEYSTYASREGENGSGAFADLRWFPEGDSIYAYYTGKDYIAPTKPHHVLIYQPGGSWPFAILPEATDRGFTMFAVGNIDGDSCPDVWMINDAKVLKRLVDDRKNFDRAEVCDHCPGVIKQTKIQKIGERIGESAALFLLAYIFLGMSPAVLVIVPVLYYLLLRERRKWKAAVAEAQDRGWRRSHISCSGEGSAPGC